MFKRATQLVFSLTLLSSPLAHADKLIDAIAHEGRSVTERLRDEYRHPQQTLRFFEVQADMAVAEISPGGGWYSNILAPLLKEQGIYYAAHFYIDENTRDYYKKSRQGFEQKVSQSEGFEKVKLTAFDPVNAPQFAPAGSLDRVLTFRNVHNWYMQNGDASVQSAFEAFYQALKEGGILGVVEHSLRESQSGELQKKSGYMKPSYVIAMAEKAGFKLVAQSDVNHNKLDNAEHEKGVWTLPPSLRLGDKERDKYLAIGESNRMTLKFVK
ncbi:MAG: putative methyltransferase [Paraglaciecola sp.]|jgi:predicted methyltransferase